MKREILINGDVAVIPLTMGYEAIIDAADVNRVAAFDWVASRSFRRNGDLRAVYAVARKNGKTVCLHRLILGDVGGLHVDHVDGDGLNNRRKNLRAATTAQNAYNQRLPISNTSGYKGVTWDKSRARWVAQIYVGGKNKKLGKFKDIEQAAAAYSRAAQAYFGEYGRAA